MAMFSARSVRDAHKYAVNAGNEAQSEAFSYLDQGRGAQMDAYNRGLYGAMGNISSGYGNARNALTSAYDTGMGAYNTGETNAANALNRGYTGALGQWQQALGGWEPYAKNGMAASSMLQNALGLNGADGNTTARNTFQAGPGYQYQVEQATDAAARKANALGVAAGGNTLAEITKIGSNLANQEWGGWLDRLTGQSDRGVTAQQAITGIRGNMAGVENGYGQNLAQLYSTMAQGRAGLSQGYGNSMAGAYTGEGNNLANQWQNWGNNSGSAWERDAQRRSGWVDRRLNDSMQANNQQAQASFQNNQNISGAAMGGVNLLAQILGSAAGGGFGGGATGGGGGGGAGIFSRLFQ